MGAALTKLGDRCAGETRRIHRAMVYIGFRGSEYAQALLGEIGVDGVAP